MLCTVTFSLLNGFSKFEVLQKATVEQILKNCITVRYGTARRYRVVFLTCWTSWWGDLSEIYAKLSLSSSMLWSTVSNVGDRSVLISVMYPLS